MMRSLYFILFIGLLAHSTAYAFLEEVVAVRLRANENGQVVNLREQTSTDIKSDVDLELRVTAPSLVKLDGRIPVLLVPVQVGSSEVKLNPPTFKEAAGETAQKEISLVVSEVVLVIQNVQKDIQKKNYDQALAKIDEVQKKYQNVAFLDFVRGSVLFLQGKKNLARKSVKKALEVHPNYQEAKDFLKTLGEPSGGDVE
ncbi:hypothetical protein [Bdellovibrio sp. HCB337]|uniref:hypothetical protein n=1 Tax=Bdellovibrio sp. HCB337 TaxID=3394358 RepID=UPI0039A478D0